MENNYIEIKIHAQIGTGDLAKKINEIDGIYKNIQFIKSNVNEHIFIAKKIYDPKLYEAFYKDVKDNLLII